MIFKKLYTTDNKWFLEYIQDEIINNEEFLSFEAAKNRCEELNFNLLWGDLNGN